MSARGSTLIGVAPDGGGQVRAGLRRQAAPALPDLAQQQVGREEAHIGRHVSCHKLQGALHSRQSQQQLRHQRTLTGSRGPPWPAPATPHLRQHRH